VFKNNFIKPHPFVRAISAVQRKKSKKIIALAIQHCALLFLISSVACNNHVNFGQLITANPSSIIFTNTQINQSSSSSLTITNSSPQPYSITTMQTSGAAFTVVSAANQQVIQPNTSVQVKIGFTPTAAQQYEGTLTVQTSVPSITLTVPLAGTGVSAPPPSTAPLAANPASLSFGNVTTGTTGSLNVSIQNTGSSAVSISGINASGTGFSVAQPTLPATINAGASLQLKVTFSPTNATAYSGSLTVASNGNPSSLSIPLSGTGTAPASTPATSTISAIPKSLAFGNVETGMNTSQTLVLTASGTAATTITSITSSNSIFTHSSVVLPLTLQPGEQASISVTAAPKTVGTESGQLTIQSNATTDASLAVPVSVDGTSASAHYVDLAWQAPTSTPTPIAGYKVYRATSASGPFTLLNTTLDSGTTYVDNSVAAGSIYYYHVTSSTSDSVESDPSNMVTVTVPTP
jgi:hypothetical protein